MARDHGPGRCGGIGHRPAKGIHEDPKETERRKQYERIGSDKAERVVKEGGLSFIVNLSDYLDTGSFLDHRPTRAMVRDLSAGKRVLNLFAYTGSFSAYAASGGAFSVTSVDLSNTYLAWASRNWVLNGFPEAAYRRARMDVSAFSTKAAASSESWDLIIADPPTFSNSKGAEEDFDVSADWASLVKACADLLAPGGTLYFSSNSRKLKFTPALAVANRSRQMGGYQLIDHSARFSEFEGSSLLENDRALDPRFWVNN